MKKEKISAIAYYVAALCFYIVALTKGFNSGDTSTRVIWICLGSAMLCLGSVYLSKIKKGNTSDKNKE
ncbi:MAG: hypothetical protein IJ766_09140 [Clostridia bacterium]|nr:hypothetical protein [Clostridia bacterium]